MMDADEEFTLSSKSKSITLKAKEKIALSSKELLGSGTQKASLESNQELALNGGAKATLRSGETKVH